MNRRYQLADEQKKKHEKEKIMYFCLPNFLRYTARYRQKVNRVRVNREHNLQIMENFLSQLLTNFRGLCG